MQVWTVNPTAMLPKLADPENGPSFLNSYKLGARGLLCATKLETHHPQLAWQHFLVPELLKTAGVGR